VPGGCTPYLKSILALYLTQRNQWVVHYAAKLPITPQSPTVSIHSLFPPENVYSFTNYTAIDTVQPGLTGAVSRGPRFNTLFVIEGEEYLSIVQNKSLIEQLLS
jgi:hypothetical protein